MAYSMQLSFKSRSREELRIRAEDNSDLEERLEVIMNQEVKYQCKDYLNIQGSSITVINEECRSRMCEWCYQTVDFFKLSRDNVHASMSVLDRFLSTSQGKPYLLKKSLYQLACVASLYISIKVHESVELGVSLLVQLGRGAYTANQILQVEQQVLLATNWKVNPPSPNAFVYLYVAMLPPSVGQVVRQDLINLSIYQIELAISDYRLSTLSQPSCIATASLFNSLVLMAEVSHMTIDDIFYTIAEYAGYQQKHASVTRARTIMFAHLTSVKASFCDLLQTICSKDASLDPDKSSLSTRGTTLQTSQEVQNLSPVAVMFG